MVKLFLWKKLNLELGNFLLIFDDNHTSPYIEWVYFTAPNIKLSLIKILSNNIVTPKVQPFKLTG